MSKYDKELLNYIVEYFECDQDNAEYFLDKNYFGKFDDEIEFAKDLVLFLQHKEGFPDDLFNYIDFKKFAKDQLKYKYRVFNNHYYRNQV